MKNKYLKEDDDESPRFDLKFDVLRKVGQGERM